MRNLIIGTVLAAFTLSSIAATEDVPVEYSGNYWFQKCSPEGFAKSTDCARFLSGLIQGAIGQAGISGAKQVFCTPKFMTNQQAADVFYQYLTQYPSLRRYDASVIAFKAFADAFPCNK